MIRAFNGAGRCREDIACPDSGFRGAGGDLEEVDPEMMSEACESSGGIYRNGLTFLAGGPVVALDSGRSFRRKALLRNRWLTARDRENMLPVSCNRSPFPFTLDRELARVPVNLTPPHD